MFSFTRMLSPRRNKAALRGLFRRLKRRESGVAAVEFAFILPLMLTMFFGLAETTLGVMVSRKVSLLNRTLADLASQTSAIDNTEKDNIFNAAKSTLSPFDQVTVGMTFSSIVIDNAGKAKVCWTEASNMSGLAAGSTIVLPTGLNLPNTSLIVAKSDYPLAPDIGYMITGTIHIGGDSIYMRPRTGGTGPTGIEQVERIGKPMC